MQTPFYAGKDSSKTSQPRENENPNSAGKQTAPPALCYRFHCFCIWIYFRIFSLISIFK